jgi:metallophosphoesterase (TIGR00282 family)
LALRVLYVGDIVGRSGRQILLDRIAELRQRLKLDALIVNGENAAGGFGITAKLAEEFLEAGVDLITTGNHVWDQKDLIPHIGQQPRIIRPLNMKPGTPGQGVGEVRTASGQRLVVIQVMSRLYMNLLDDPFRALQQELKKLVLGGNAQAIMVDIHGEATSEKTALGHFLDGSVSLVAGTHTHIPTADHQILPGGTAYITDVGMTGDYDGVIGMDKAMAVPRWLTDVPGKKLEPAAGPATLCGVYVETDDRTGLATRCEPLRIGGRLAEVWPES